MEQNKDQSSEIPLCEQGNFYSLAKVRGFTDFGMTLSGKFYDEALQRFNEQYDASLAGEVVQSGAAVRGEAVAESIGDDRDFKLALDDYAEAVRDGAISKRVGARWHLERTIDNFHAPADQVSTPIHKAPTWPERTYVSAAIDVIAEVSARAADAPSEPSGLTFDQWLDRKDENGWTEREAPCGEFRDMLRGWNAAMKFGKSRAADALDSQPTVIAYVATDLDGRADVGMTPEKAMERAGHGCDTIIPVYDLGRSQPTDGGVRNG